MPELEDNKQELDPVILAAMIEDPDEDDEEKAMRAEILGTDKVVDSKEVDEDEDKNDDDSDEDEDEEKPPKKEKKPVEAEDDDDSDDDEDDDKDDEDEDEDEKKPTRKKKRQERFIESILKDTPSTSRKPTDIPDYKPVDYSKPPETGFKETELEEDRERHGAIQFVKGAETVRYWAEQDRFWSDLKQEAKIASYDPDLTFLTEKLPNGQKNPKFDPDKTAEINEVYFQMVGFKQEPKKNDKGEPLYDAQTREPLVVSTVQRTDISYEKFARRYVANMKNWANEGADSREEEVIEKVTKQKKNQGVRPNGGKRKTLGALQPGDITRMSDEELEKNEAEIDRQILAML